MFRLKITDPILTEKCLEKAKALQDLPSLVFPLPSSPGDIISFINSDQGQIFIDNAFAIFDQLKAWAIQQRLNADMLDEIKQRFTRNAVNKRTGFNDFFELCTKGLRYFKGINIHLAEESRSLAFKKHIIADLLEDMKGKCEDGIDTYAKKTCDLLSADPLVLLVNVKRHIAEQAANLTLAEYELGGNQIHYATALINHYHDQLGIDQEFDTHAPLGLSDDIFLKFVENFSACMTVDKFITELAVQFDLALVEEALKNDVAKTIKAFEARLAVLGCDPLFKMLQLFDQAKLADDEYVFGFGANKVLRATLIERLCSSGYLKSNKDGLIGGNFNLHLKNDGVFLQGDQPGQPTHRIPLLCALLTVDETISLRRLWGSLFIPNNADFLHANLQEINESPELIGRLMNVLHSNEALIPDFSKGFSVASKRKIYTNIFIALIKEELVLPATLQLITSYAACVRNYDRGELFSRNFDVLMMGNIKLDICALFSSLEEPEDQEFLLTTITPKKLISYFHTLSELVNFLKCFPVGWRFDVYNKFSQHIHFGREGFFYEERLNALMDFLKNVTVDLNQLDKFLMADNNVHIWAVKIKENYSLFALLNNIKGSSLFHYDLRAKLLAYFIVDGIDSTNHFSLHDLVELERLTLSDIQLDRSGEAERIVKMRLIQLFSRLDWEKLIISNDAKLFFEKYFRYSDFYKNIAPFNFPRFKCVWRCLGEYWREQYKQFGLIRFLRMASQLQAVHSQLVADLAISKLSKRQLYNEVDVDGLDLDGISPWVLAKMLDRTNDLMSSLTFIDYPPRFVVCLLRYVCDKIDLPIQVDFTKIQYDKNNGYEKFVYFAAYELPKVLNGNGDNKSKFFSKNVSLFKVSAAIKTFLNSCGLSLPITISEKIQLQLNILKEINDLLAREDMRHNHRIARL